MGKDFGVVTRYKSHVGRFPLAFWEVKDVGGAWREPLAGAVPMVSCFGDNRMAKSHPDWVQIGPDGLRGTRDAPYFDWDTLCPSRSEVQAAVEEWIWRALAAPDASLPGLRLDDVTFAREGFCQCPVCRERQTASGLSWAGYRTEVLTRFVEGVKRKMTGPLYFTLYPDPFPGHLESRFGLSVDALRPFVDGGFVVPLYDIHYGTTYWVEVLASAFRDVIGDAPLYIELYGLGVEEPRLVKAAQVAASYADGVLVAYDKDLDKLLRVEAAVRSSG